MATSKYRVRLGQWLRDLRVAAGLTQWQVADELGYETPQYASNWERGVSLPPIDVTATLAKLFGVKRGELVRRIYDARIAELKAERDGLCRRTA